MKKILHNLNESLYGIRIAFSGYSYHSSCMEIPEEKELFDISIPTMVDDRINLKNDSKLVAKDLKKAYDKKMAEAEK